MRPLLGLLLALAAACGPGAAARGEGEEPGAGRDHAPPGARLGDDAAPRAYELEVEIDPDRPAFRARVAIDIEVRRPLSVLWLHGVELEIERAALLAGGIERPAAFAPGPGGAGLLGFSIGGAIPAGPARLEVVFRGPMRTQDGLFRQETGGRFYAYTDFQATDARRAFVSFDEPRFKAPWRIALVVPAGHQAFSNMPLARTRELADGRVRFEFETTPPLPTYLVAFAAGPFDVVTAAAGRIPIRAVVPRGRGRAARTALELTPAILAILEEYLGAPAPFPKIDLVAVPRFHGAMENPGLFTFTEGILLVDEPARRAGPDAHRVRLLAGVLAHEIAHLWFGDWVTPAWWDDLWLSEGLATWLSDVALTRLWPARGRPVLEVADRTPALRVDRTLAAGPVRRRAESEREIRALFDPLTYRKGGALLEMLASYLGEEAMAAVLGAYLEAHGGRSVTAAAFLDALTNQAGPGAAAALAAFLEQPGIPLVRAELRCEGGAARLELGQRRLLSVHDAGRASAEERARRWPIPVCARHPGGAAGAGPARACTLLSEDRGRLDLGPGCPAWVHPNAGGAGYYHVWMPASDLIRLAAADLDEREAAHLALDVEALLAAGEIDLEAALAALAPLAARPEPAVTERVGGILRELSRSVVTDATRPGFADHVRALYGERARRLGVSGRPGDSEAVAALRWEVVTLAGDEGEDPELRRQARARAESWLRSGTALKGEADLLALLLSARAGDAALFEAIRAALADASSSPRDQALATALGAFSDRALFRRALDLALSGPDDELAERIAEAGSQNPRVAGVILEALAEAHAERRAPGRVSALAPTLLSRQCSEEAARLARDLGGRRLALLATEIARCVAAARAHRAAAARAFGAGARPLPRSRPDAAVP